MCKLLRSSSISDLEMYISTRPLFLNSAPRIFLYSYLPKEGVPNAMFDIPSYHFQREGPYERGQWRQNTPHSPTRLLIEGGKIISIIGDAMSNIVATRIIIVFAKIGGVY